MRPPPPRPNASSSSGQAARDPGMKSRSSISARPARDAVPRRLIVTAGVVAFAICDWSLWVLLRVGPWGPPMRLVLGKESVSDAVERTLDAILRWADSSMLVQLKSGWQEQQVHVWGSTEQGAAVSLIHSILLRANRDELRPHLLHQPVPSLHVQWVPVVDVESGRWNIDLQAQPGVLAALQSLRAYILHNPEVILRYLADMGQMSSIQKKVAPRLDERLALKSPGGQRNTLPLDLIKPPESGSGTLTLEEAVLLYQAFLPIDELCDDVSVRQRLLATGKLVALDEEHAVRGYDAQEALSGRLYFYQED